MKIIGHRGAKGLAPENTIAAFKKALEHHVDEIEFDVRVTKDHIPILSHDPTLADASSTKLLVKDATYEKLKAHKPDLTTLSEALSFIDTKAYLLIEVKPKEPVGPINKVLQEFLNSGSYSDTDFSLGSFSQKTLLELQKLLPNVEKVVIENWSGVHAHIRCRQLDTKRINMKALWLWRGFLAGVKRGDYQIAPYTMNDPAKVRKWEKYLYGVVTDYPDRFEK